MSARYRPGVAAADLATILQHTPGAAWDSLRGERLFITGGTGFLGCWLLEALLWGHEQLGLELQLCVLSRNPAAFRARAPHLAAHPAVQLLAGDAGALGQIKQPFDSVLHLATDVLSPAADPAAVFQAIVRGAEQTLALAERCGARRYLLTSSGAVYGPQPPGLTHVPESYAGAPSTMAPGSAYGEGKRVAEWLAACARERSGLAVQVARCFAFVGPYMALDAQFAIGNFIRDALAGGPVRVGGDGTPHRSYLYAADLAVWLLAILAGGDQQPYNVGSAEAISIAALAQRVSAVLPGQAPVQLARAPVPGSPASYYVPAVDRARSLGLAEYTDLTTAIARTAAWQRPSGEM